MQATLGPPIAVHEREHEHGLQAAGQLDGRPPGVPPVTWERWDVMIAADEPHGEVSRQGQGS